MLVRDRESERVCVSVSGSVCEEVCESVCECVCVRERECVCVVRVIESERECESVSV